MAKSTATGLKQAIRSVEALLEHSAVSDRELLRRFAEDKDQQAFAALVRRYTGMVLGVCRRVLPTTQDAEDACQATFLVLARKATGGEWRQSVANWLYTTARRVASNARLAAERRAKREGRAAIPAVVSPVDQVTGRELLVALDEELERLPASYREPLVLCYLEGFTREEIATRLGVPAATVKTQLQRGRKKLGDALTRRGCGLGAGLLALAVTSPAGASPPRLVEAVLVSVFGSPPEAVAALAKGVLVNTLVKKSLPAVLIVAATALLGIGVAALNLSAAAQPAQKAHSGVGQGEAKEAKWTPGDDKDSIVYAGRVIDPEGRPVPGAKLHLTQATGYHKKPAPSPVYGTTGPDGRFRFAISKARLDQRSTVIVATAANHGPGWVRVNEGSKRHDLTLQLVPDDVAITGLIVDLEGKPVAGVTLTVLQINAAPGEDLDPWLKAAKAKNGNTYDLEHRYVNRHTIALSPKVTTDAAGRFRLNGIGRNRIVRAQLDGATIASEQLCLLTRSGKPIEVTFSEGRKGTSRVVTTYYGADFRHAAAPSTPIVGVVRDKDTKKPLAGVTVQSDKMGSNPYSGVDIVRVTTDAQGRYRLTGMPKSAGSKLLAVPDGDLPYLGAGKEVPDSAGLQSVTVDFELKRGIWIEGKLTDKVTGKPLKGYVEYFAIYSNPNLGDYPAFRRPAMAGGTAAKEDGSYRVVGLPGPGLVGVYYQRDPYLRAHERDDEVGTKEQSLQTAPYIISFTSNFNAIARIDPAKGEEPVRRNIDLDPGWTFKGTVVGPDAKPLTGTRGFDVNSRRWWDQEPKQSATFTGGFNPRRPYDILFLHGEKGLVGVGQPPKENGGSVTVRMEPGAAVSGRLIDAGGKPRAGVELEVSFRPKGLGYWCEYLPDRVRTDREGRFRVEPVIPGTELRLSDGKGNHSLADRLRSGETKNLGDIRMKRAEE